MKKILALTISALLLQTGMISTASAAMRASWLPANKAASPTMPHDFRGKLENFHYSNLTQLPPYGSQIEVTAEIEDSQHNLVSVTMTGDDLAFGSTLHDAVGKNVWLLISESDAVVTEFSVLNDENRWYQPRNAAAAK